MKRIVLLALILHLALSCISWGMAENINVASLSDSQLRLLLDQAQAELSHRLALARTTDDGYVLFDDMGFRHLGYELVDYYNGEKKLYFDFEWKNYGDQPKPFFRYLDFKAFQDGIQIDELAYNSGLISEQNRTQYRTEVMPGYALKAACIFILPSDSPVTIYVQRWSAEDLIFVVDPADLK